jgi:hypothetical protein
MNLKSRLKKHLKPIEKYLLKHTFWLEKLMKLMCNELGNEYQNMF